MSRIVGRLLGCKHGYVLAAAVVSWALCGCQDPLAPPLDECGNGVIEPAIGEDCEPVQDPQRCGAVGSGAPACRWTCTVSECPEGFHCGIDAICRRPCLGHEGAPSCNPFAALSTDVTLADVADVMLVDVAGDARPEIITVESASDPAGARARVYTYDGDGFVAQPSIAVGERATLSALETGGPIYLLAARGPLPAVPDVADPSDTTAIVSLLTEALAFEPVLIQGPEPLDDGPIRLVSYVVPPDVPTLGGQTLVLGFRPDEVWQADTLEAPLVAAGAPEDLIGPALARPVSAALAAAEGHLASEYCPTWVYGYRGGAQLRSANPCVGVAPGWTAAPLSLPAPPRGTLFGDGLVASDANGDGLDDLIVTTGQGRVHIAYAVGDGTFHSEVGTLPPGNGDGSFDAGVGPQTNTAASVGVIAVGDFNRDGAPDFLTRSSWIRSCGVPGCGTCDTDGYRCDTGPDAAPRYQATQASVTDFDGDGALELAVLATDQSDALAGPDAWGPITPTSGDLIVIDDPGAAQWSARVIPLDRGAVLRGSGDLDGDGRSEVVLTRPSESGDTLIVVFGGSGMVHEVRDFDRIVDAHIAVASQTLAVISEDADGTHRRLSKLTATDDQRLRSRIGLELTVVPRTLVPGRFDRAHPQSLGIAALGEHVDGGVDVELLTRGDSDFFDASTRVSARTELGIAVEHAVRTRAVAVDLDGDDLDELVVFAPDGAIRTLRVDPERPQFSGDVVVRNVTELYAGPAWPAQATSIGAGTPPTAQDLDGDGDADLWLLTAEDPPRLTALRNTGDGTLDIAGRTVIAIPPLSLSVCEDEDCRVFVRAFSAFGGPSQRSLSVGPNAFDVLLVSRRALFLWTVDPFDATTADALDVVELAVVGGSRAPLSPVGGPVLGVVGDIDGDGVDDVVAGGRNGLRWLRGLAVNP